MLPIALSPLSSVGSQDEHGQFCDPSQPVANLGKEPQPPDDHLHRRQQDSHPNGHRRQSHLTDTVVGDLDLGLNPPRVFVQLLQHLNLPGHLVVDL